MKLVFKPLSCAAATAITSAGTAIRLVLFTPERSSAIAAVSGINLDGRFVNKFHNSTLIKKMIKFFFYIIYK